MLFVKAFIAFRFGESCFWTFLEALIVIEWLIYCFRSADKYLSDESKHRQRISIPLNDQSISIHNQPKCVVFCCRHCVCRLHSARTVSCNLRIFVCFTALECVCVVTSRFTIERFFLLNLPAFRSNLF